MTDLVTALREALDHTQTPCFVVLLDQVLARIDAVERAFGGRFKLSYAVKANPNPDLLAHLARCVPYLDISSGGELDKALASGWASEKISFTGPGKRDTELRASVAAAIGEVVVESVHEARRLDEFADAAGCRQKIAIRITPAEMPPGFGAQMAGRPSPFGIDEEQFSAALPEIRALSNLELTGLHIYSGAQCLDSIAISKNYLNYLRIFRDACARAELTPTKLIFGAGLGIPYHDHETDLDLQAVADGICPALDDLAATPGFEHAEFVLETGRYLVGEAGYYLTRIVNMKSSRGMEICICDGGMNHNLAACGLMGMVIPRNYRFFKLGPSQRTDEALPYQLVGPLCTSIDTLGRQVELPPLTIGDVIAMRTAGAYGATASPVHFISHPYPHEVIVSSSRGESKFEVSQQR